MMLGVEKTNWRKILRFKRTGYLPVTDESRLPMLLMINIIEK